MSVALMTEIWKTCLYPGATRAVLLVLADHGHDDGSHSYPGVAQISCKTLLSERQVKYSLRQLEEDRVIIPQDDELSGGRHQKTRYFIDLKRVHSLHRLHQEADHGCKWCQERVHIAARNSALRDRKGANGDRPIRKNHPEQSIEPSSNPPARDGWEEIWKALGSLPGHQPTMAEASTRLAWANIAPPKPPDADLLAAIGEFGDWLAAENRRRAAMRPPQAAVMIQHHKRWLADRGWEPFLAMRRAKDQIGTPLALAVPSEIAIKMVAVGFRDAEIDAWFGRGEFDLRERSFTHPTQFGANWIRTQFSARLERAFGEGFQVRSASDARKASAA